MASLRTKAPVGSAPWLVTERRQVDEFIAQEVEEFGFAARNEMEWLNEHMADIFAPGNLYEMKLHNIDRLFTNDA
jgi:hypothetical protein